MLKLLSLSLQALKAVKGVLNKLTPEKFERLLQQLLDAVKSVTVLRGLITLIFENAVAQVRSCTLPLAIQHFVHYCLFASAFVRVQEISLCLTAQS